MRRAAVLGFGALLAALAAAGSAGATSACQMGGVGADSFCWVHGVRLHLVDWGGKGPPLILLAGLNNSARIFDDLAPRLAHGRHVYALTRRGFGLSDQPASDYDTPSLVADIIAEMDALGIARADFVGHSIAGAELSRLAVDHPERVRRLVYLDAAYDRREAATFGSKDPGEPRAPPPDALKDFSSLIAWRIATLGFASSAVAADLRDIYQPDSGGLVSRTPRTIPQAVSAGDRASPPDYSRIRAPALALYAPKARPEQVPPEASSARRQASLDYSLLHARPWMLREKARFDGNIGCGQSREVPGAGHYFFLEQPAATAAAIDGFLRTTKPC